jgi:CMP-N-acetylneuraminic acid synthetase
VVDQNGFPKNVREVGSKPLIAHTIEHAEQADRIDQARVSTDDEQIAAVVEQYGGYVPFMRPAELVTDTAATADVITHAVDWATENFGQFDTICLL